MLAGLQGHGTLLVGVVMFLVGLMAGSTLDLSGRQPMDGRHWHRQQRRRPKLGAAL